MACSTTHKNVWKLVIRESRISISGGGGGGGHQNEGADRMHASIKLNVRRASIQAGRQAAADYFRVHFFDPDGRIDYFLPDCTIVHDSIGASGRRPASAMYIHAAYV
jgi:hypothetical protein